MEIVRRNADLVDGASGSASGRARNLDSLGIRVMTTLGGIAQTLSTRTLHKDSGLLRRA